jgi:hypothetical protein
MMVSISSERKKNKEARDREGGRDTARLLIIAGRDERRNSNCTHKNWLSGTALN